MDYKRVNESSESLLESHSEGTESHSSVEQQVRSRRRRHRGMRWGLTVMNICLFISSLTVYAAVYLKDSDSEIELMKKCSFYSPVFDKGIDLQTYTMETEGRLFGVDQASVYRNKLAPDTSVDRAWHALEYIRTFPITAAQVRKLGKDPSIAVKFPPEYGLGDDAYMAQIDLFHQLHCLNLLRHLAWNEYDRNGTAKKPYSDVHWIHVSHCTDILAQNLMCTGSLDVLTFNWLETQVQPWPDFNVNHKCRDFGQIVQWQLDNTVPKEWSRNVTRPPGTPELPMPDEYFEVYGIERESR